jgi:hypothetical protein
MAAVTATASLARPLDGSISVIKEAGEALDLLNAVYLATNGKVMKTANSTSKFYGFVVAGHKKGTAVASGEMCTVVVFGRLTGFSGMQPGVIGKLSATAGKIDQTTGTVSTGYAESASEYFVMPNISDVGSS